MPKIKALYGLRSLLGTDEDLVRVVDDQGGELKLTRVDFDAWKHAHPAATPQDAEEFIVAHFAELEDCDVYVHVHDLAESCVAVLVARKGLEEVEPNWWTVDITGLTVNSDTIGRYEKFEVTFGIDAEFQDPYDPEEVSVEAIFNAPSGNKIRAYGFYYVPYQTSCAGEYLYFNRTEDPPTWRVRFAPEELGEYTGTVKVTTQFETTSAAIPSFQVEESDNPGFVRIGDSGRFFGFDDGDWFYPLGQNIYPSYAQVSSYEGQTVSEHEMTMRRIEENNGKVFRFLMIGYNASLRWTNPDEWTFDVWPGYDGVNSINQMSAEKIDQAIELAGELGLYMNLSALHASTLHREPKGWPRFPYNDDNGGPAECPINFFTDPNIKDLYKQELRYIISRWGYSPNLFIIELLQELNLLLREYDNEDHTENTIVDPVKAWSAEMTAYLRSIDPYGHLVSTSDCEFQYSIITPYKSNLVVNGMYDAGGYDVAQQHIYCTNFDLYGHPPNRNVVKSVELLKMIQDLVQKPWIIGEWGLSLDGSNDLLDTNGIGFHNILWASTMRGSTSWQWMGLPRSAPTNLLSFPRASAFLQGEDFEHDFGALSAEDSRADVSGSPDEVVYAVGIASEVKALVWVQDTESIELLAEPPPRSGVTLTLRELADGNYDVEFWDTWSDTVIPPQVSNSTDGSMTIPLPDFTRDIALKINRRL